MSLKAEFEKERWMRNYSAVINQKVERLSFADGAEFGFKKAIELLRQESKDWPHKDHGWYAEWLQSKLDEK